MMEEFATVLIAILGAMAILFMGMFIADRGTEGKYGDFEEMIEICEKKLPRDVQCKLIAVVEDGK